MGESTQRTKPLASRLSVGLQLPTLVVLGNPGTGQAGLTDSPSWALIQRNTLASRRR